MRITKNFWNFGYARVLKSRKLFSKLMNSSRDLSNKSARLSNTRFYCLNKLPWLSEIYKIIQEIIGSGNSACQIITSKQEHTRRKICQNTGFLWPVYFRITAESLILSLNGKRRVTENWYFGGIFYAVISKFH